jgi:hypothetical protein
MSHALGGEPVLSFSQTIRLAQGSDFGGLGVGPEEHATRTTHVSTATTGRVVRDHHRRATVGRGVRLLISGEPLLRITCSVQGRNSHRH